MRAALALLVLLAVASSAAGHGGSTQQQKALGPYRVTFFSYDYVTEGEALQASWEILRNDTGALVDAGEAVVVVTEVAADGTASPPVERHPAQAQRGFLVLEIQAGRQGLLRYDLRLDGHNATFEQQVCSIDSQGQLACGLRAPAARTPLPVALALVALGLAAARRPR